MKEVDLENHAIVVFTAPSCAFCVMVKSYLLSQNVAFHEIDLSTDQAAVVWLQEKVGRVGVPVTLFANKDFVVGWQKDLIDEHLSKLDLK